MAQSQSQSQLLFVFAFCIATSTAIAATSQELLRGFTATPNPKISTNFQQFLTDSSGNFSFGFLRVNTTLLSLAVIHLPSSEPIWTTNMTRLPRWSNPTQLIFNGSLVVSDPHSGVFWSTYTDGDRVFLSNSSNLQIQAFDGSNLQSVIWESFDFPTDTLVENQNFTSAMSLISSNGLYSMRLGSDFIGLYAKFQSGSYPSKIYWKHKALEAKASVIPSEGPIYAVLKSDGFLGMYQNGSTPVDVQSFNSYQQPVSGVRRLRIETDGNLRGYFWTGASWITDYEAISDSCELPSSCGSYGLCKPGNGCSCLDNQTDYNSGKCSSSENQDSGDFCSVYGDKYTTLRRNGIELPYKELMGYQKMASLEECEGTCEENCTCWGAVYSNSSGFCYMLDYPIQTLLSVGDESKVGYFKVREGVGKGKVNVGLGVGLGVLCGTLLVFGGVVGIWWCRFRKRKRGVSGYVDDDGVGGVGPYKDLGAASFRSIELSER
ncbi:hypothetical protein M9H77_24153 [Catharanthus roseus]|uniref:Uncharacterized protein n=1 Tax=Catharanthus roseus TaxID=4058 RepID=A0ACC0AWU5_CATRO|nr:hypothetical protein M9H77_24153 [Catharanthus roseus]